MSRWFFLFSWIMTFVLYYLFAHGYVIQALNQQTQTQHNLLASQQADFVWDFTDFNRDIVSVFRSDWLAADQKISTASPSPQLSLDFNGYSADPQLFDVVKLNVEQGESAKVRLELNAQDSDVYYYSSDIVLHTGENRLNLAELPWHRLTVGESKLFLAKWSSIKKISSLVMRFKQASGATLTLRAVSMPQTRLKAYPEQGQLNCALTKNAVWSGKFSTACLLSNQMVFLNQHINLQSNDASLLFEPFEFPVYVFMLAAVLMLATSLVFAGQNNNKSGKKFTLGLLFIFTFLSLLLHSVAYRWLTASPSMIWLILSLLAIGMLLVQKKHFIQVDKDRCMQAMISVLLPSVLLAAVLWFISDFSGEFASRVPLYLFWATVQQLLLGPILAEKIRDQLACSDFKAAMLAALLFSLIHSPNHMLMLVTLPAGLFWAWAWLRFRCIYPLIVSHALLALLFYQAMPVFYLYSARVGLGFI